MSRRKVLWKNGTLLAPQHLQQADRYLETQLRPRTPQSFGLIECVFDEQALAHGKFGLRRCLAVLPDGLLVDIGGSGEGELGDDIAPSSQPVRIPDGQGGLGVWLGIPDPQSDQRFVAEVENTADDYNPSNQRPVTVGRKNLRYVFADQARTGLTTLQLAVLERQGSDSLQTRASFIPTSLTLQGSPWFARFLSRLINRLESRIREQLQKAARSPSEESLLIHLSRCWASLRHLQSEDVFRSTHPERLYALLIDLAGGMGATLDKEPLALATYQHTNQTACFGAIEARLDTLLATKARSRVLESVNLPIASPNDIYWTGTLDKENLKRTKIRLYLVVIGGSLSRDEMIHLVMADGLLGGGSGVKDSRNYGLPGLSVEFVSGPGIEHYTAGGEQPLYFRLKTEEYPQTSGKDRISNNAFGLWNELRTTGAITVYLPKFDLRPPYPQLSILVIQDEGTP